MNTLLVVTVFYDGASEAPASGSYDSAAPPIGAFAFFNTYVEAGTVAPPAETPSIVPSSGGGPMILPDAPMRRKQGFDYMLLLLS